MKGNSLTHCLTPHTSSQPSFLTSCFTLLTLEWQPSIWDPQGSVLAGGWALGFGLN